MSDEDPPPWDAFVDALDRAHALAVEEMARARDPENAEERQELTAQQRPPEWAEEMRIRGVAYTVTVEKARELGWTLSTPEAGEGNDKFVHVLPAMDQKHMYLKLANLGNDCNAIPVEGYSKESMARILAHVSEGVYAFAEKWVARG